MNQCFHFSGPHELLQERNPPPVLGSERGFRPAVVDLKRQLSPRQPFDGGPVNACDRWKSLGLGGNPLHRETKQALQGVVRVDGGSLASRATRSDLKEVCGHFCTGENCLLNPRIQTSFFFKKLFYKKELRIPL